MQKVRTFNHISRQNHRPNPAVQPPQIQVHHILPSKPRGKFLAARLFPTTPIVLALCIGIGLGSFVMWQSKYGSATPSEQAPVESRIVAATTDEPWIKPLEFDQSELEIVSDLLPLLLEENRHVPTPEEIKNTERKEQLRAYLADKKSPFAQSDETLQAFLDAKNMKLMLAISFVESTLGKKCYYHNCSGIGGYPPNLRKYESHADWVKDFDDLLERRYKGVPIEDFMGLYVKPGSPNWINGVKQILSELKQQGIE